MGSTNTIRSKEKLIYDANWKKLKSLRVKRRLESLQLWENINNGDHKCILSYAIIWTHLTIFFQVFYYNVSYIKLQFTSG